MSGLQQTIGGAVKAFRIARGRTQENLGVSQSYVSFLERGGHKNATIAKVDEIGRSLGVHPLSIVAAAYRLAYPEVSREELLKQIERELSEIGL